MDLTKTVNQINFEVMQFAPMAMAGVLAAQASGKSGADKKAAVIAGVLAGAKMGGQLPIPQVAAISSLIEMFVTIFKALGVHGFNPSVVPVPSLIDVDATNSSPANVRSF